MEGSLKKVGINCDMGEGFGRWKMVGFHSQDGCKRGLALLTEMLRAHRGPMKSS